MAPSQNPSPARPAARTPSSNPPLPDFTDPSFDPADFLNDVLPPLTLASSQPHTRAAGSVPLADLSAQVQSLLSQISAQNVRLSDTLTQLTDEILRSGGRLAYEVEVLRGEAIGLRDSLTEGLQHDITKFVPDGPAAAAESRDAAPEEQPEEGEPNGKLEATTVEDPEYIRKLRTLNQVRARLDDVVRIFGDAMEWPLPPSEVSLTSSFISVAGPEPGPESHSREEKGQEVARKLRAQVAELLDSDGGGQAGVEAASRRVEAVRVLATVWKGSAEEKARNRLVDSLAKIVDDRRKALDQAMAESQRSQSTKRQSMDQRRDSDSGPGGGIFRNLQRLRDEIYLE